MPAPRRTRPLILIGLLAVALAAPALAQEDPQVPDNRLRGLLGDMLGAVNPYLQDLAEMLGDLSGWHAPEVLPNGDILIRRRAPETAPEGPGQDQPLGEPLEL
ncbi:hypothetical protein LCM17_00265 [Cereibacter sphaeroides]|nr:hypothetical protein [Cereibacter sphaeroides]